MINYEKNLENVIAANEGSVCPNIGAPDCDSDFGWSPVCFSPKGTCFIFNVFNWEFISGDALNVSVVMECALYV